MIEYYITRVVSFLFINFFKIMLSKIFDKISFWSLFSIITLMPIFFLPFTKVPVESAKGFLLVIGLVITVIFWTIARFIDGKIILPKSWIILSFLSTVFIFLISALFSGSKNLSFFGIMFDIGTFYFILSVFLLMFFSAVLLKDQKRFIITLLGFILSSFILFIFQVFHLIFPKTLSLQILFNKTDNLLGSWNTFGIFAGLFIILSLVFLEFFKINKLQKIFISIFLLVSLFFVLLVNIPVIWCLVGVFSLFIFIYKVSISGLIVSGISQKRFPAIPFIIVVASLLFFIGGNLIGSFLPNKFGISNIEVRPSFISTMSVAKSVLTKDPILGAGPNRFSEMWDLYKPQVINNTLYWNSGFDSGSGFFPTILVNTGILGALSVLTFLAFFLFAGFNILFISLKKNGLNSSLFLFFILTFYLLVSAFLYSVGFTLLVLIFVFLGIFIGIYCANKSKGEISFSFLEDPRKSFLFIILLITIILITIFFGFKYVQKFSSIFYFQNTMNAKSVELAEKNINKAIALHPNDLYLRTYAQVYLLKFNSLLSNKTEQSFDANKPILQSSLDQAINGAKAATNYGKNNYLNFRLLGIIYEKIIPFGIEGAYDKALEAYKKASSLSPLNPSLKIDLARLAFLNKNILEAKNYAKDALILKNDSVDALIMISQIAKNEGDIKTASMYAQYAVSIAPNDSSLQDYANSLSNSIQTETEIVNKINTDINTKEEKNKKQ